MSNSRKFDQITIASEQMREAALSVLFSSLEEPHRTDNIQSLLAKCKAGKISLDGLIVALDGDQIVDCLLVLLLSGRTAMLSFSQLSFSQQSKDTDSPQRTNALVERAVKFLQSTDVTMAQVLLGRGQSAAVDALNSNGFQHEVDLHYMVAMLNSPLISFSEDESAANTTDSEKTASKKIEFVQYCPEFESRLSDVVQQTYQGTLDCPQLDGVRPIEDVLVGYRETGEHDPSRWFIITHQNQDVGCLLLTDHPAEHQWELIYMGIVPQQRGNRWGYEIVRHAQRMAHQAAAERIVLAVDTTNHPAINMYTAAGFTQWDTRSVFIRQF